MTKANTNPERNKIIKELMKKGDGHLIDENGNIIYPDVVLRCGNGRAIAQKAAGMKVINPRCITKFTLNKIKVKRLVRKHTNVKTPHFHLVKNKKHEIIKKININTIAILVIGFIYTSISIK
mgnify:CR=1 FL=1